MLDNSKPFYMHRNYGREILTDFEISFVPTELRRADARFVAQIDSLNGHRPEVDFNKLKIERTSRGNAVGPAEF